MLCQLFRGLLPGRDARLVLIAGAWLLCVAGAHGQIIPIVNADFETIYETGTTNLVTAVPIAATGDAADAIPYTGLGNNCLFVNNSAAAPSVDVPGWTNALNGGGVEKLGTGPVASAGGYDAGFDTNGTVTGYVGAFMPPTPASIAQILGASLQPNTVYTLSLDVLRRHDQLSVGSAGGTEFPDSFAASLLAGSTPLVSSGLSYTVPATPGASVPYSMTFDSADPSNAPLVGQTLQIVFSTATGQVNIDNVSLQEGLVQQAPTWKADASGQWDVAANWNGGVPNGIDAAALVGMRVSPRPN